MVLSLDPVNTVHISSTDHVLSVGGAQAIGAMAYGVSAKRGGDDDEGGKRG